MNADLEGGHGHPVAVPEPRVWMTTTTEPKAAQAVATMGGPRQKVDEIGRATRSSLAASEREARGLTWCKQVMVQRFGSSPRSKHQRPKTPTQQNPLDCPKARLVRGGTRPSVYCLLQHPDCKLQTPSQSLEAPGYTSRRYEDPWLDRHGFTLAAL